MLIMPPVLFDAFFFQRDSYTRESRTDPTSVVETHIHTPRMEPLAFRVECMDVPGGNSFECIQQNKTARCDHQ